MARGDILFAQYDLGIALLEQDKRIKEAVERINSQALLSRGQDDLCDEIEREFRIEVPLLNEDRVEIDQREAQIDVSQDEMRMIFDRSEPFFTKGTEVSFFVPYSGDHNLFKFRPNAFTLNPPCAEVKDTELVLRYTRLNHDAEALKREFQNDLTSIRNHLQTQRNQVKQFNETLRSRIQAFVAERRNHLLKSQGMAAALAYPIRRRADAAATYSESSVRRKPPIARSPNPSKPFKPEPALDLAEYEHILGVISNMVHVIERSPGAFKGMKEEDLRQHFLVQLNGQYEGQATGETFNFEGKTDILIRAEGRNIFIAECKFWRGPESLRETIDQLLGYASWRDTKTAIMIFNRDRQLSTVLPKIVEVFKAHPNFKRQHDYKSETGFRFALHHRDDNDRELLVTALVFEVPA
jgi:hypothetical protein